MTDHGKSDVSKLKPCPFCGGDPFLDPQVSSFGGASVICSECGAKTETVKVPGNDEAGDTKAISAWNRRTETAQ